MKNTKHQVQNKYPSTQVPKNSSARRFRLVFGYLGIWKFFGAWGLMFGVSPSAFACATCYGASDSAMAQGMNWGIATLLGVIGSVLFGVVAFFVHVGRKSARLSAGEVSQTDKNP